MALLNKNPTTWITNNKRRKKVQTTLDVFVKFKQKPPANVNIGVLGNCKPANVNDDSCKIKKKASNSKLDASTSTDHVIILSPVSIKKTTIEKGNFDSISVIEIPDDSPIIIPLTPELSDPHQRDVVLSPVHLPKCKLETSIMTSLLSSLATVNQAHNDRVTVATPIFNIETDRNKTNVLVCETPIHYKEKNIIDTVISQSIIDDSYSIPSSLELVEEKEPTERTKSFTVGKEENIISENATVENSSSIEIILPKARFDKKSPEIIGKGGSSEKIAEINQAKSSKRFSINDSIFNQSFDNWTSKNEAKKAPEENFAYKADAVRKKDERKKLCGYACQCCKAYFDALNLTPEEKNRRINAVSRHRDNQAPPATPDNFWEVGFPSTAQLDRRKSDKHINNESPIKNVAVVNKLYTRRKLD